MSKAFSQEETTFEEDDAPEEPSPLPVGARNYMTPGGFARLKNELDRLTTHERPELVATVAWAASNGDRSENADYIYGKKRLREIDRRLKFLGRRLSLAVVVNPLDQPKDQVLFGACVTVIDEGDTTLVYKIVGEDEINIENR